MRNARIDNAMNHARFDDIPEGAPGSFGRAAGLGIDACEANTFVDEAGPLAYGVPVGGGGTGALEESAAVGCVHWESFVLTRRFYHTRACALRPVLYPRPGLVDACDEERAPSQATPPLR